MTYVHVPVATSQNSQRLARDLQTVIEEHQRQYPGLSKAEIDQAMQIAGRATGAKKRTELVLALVAGVLLAAGLLAFFLIQRG